ncbi:MAG: hypothetical protein GX881_02285 [Firmicutes bacterium]|nr:hypothetical protein [Bacillota bacterium]
MRELGVWLGLLLFTLALLYGGLNAAERGISAIMAPACLNGAFLIRHDPGTGFGITLTFAGRTVRLYVSEWWDRLRG